MNPVIRIHLEKADPILSSVFHRIELPPDLESSTDYYLSLTETIINQQLSEKAGATITSRFYGLFPKKKVTPERVLATQPEKLRGVGMSWSKVHFIRDLATHVIQGKTDFVALQKMEDEAIIVELIKIKGIGRWTAEMFLMFTLGRPDVFSFGDVGLQNAIQKLYGLKKKPSVTSMKRLSNKWKPYRTYAARILWRSLDQKK